MYCKRSLLILFTIGLYLNFLNAFNILKCVITGGSRLNAEEKKNLMRVLIEQVTTCRTMSLTTLRPILMADESTKHIDVKKAHEWLKHAVEKHRVKLVAI